MFYIVYKITNQLNNRYYIGSHRTKKLHDHYMGSGKIIKEAIQKYGVENFKREYIFFAFDKKSMSWAEEQLVSTQDNDPLSYNIVPGGGRPPINVKRGLKNPQLSQKNKERVWTQEMRDKISKANSGEKNGLYGKKRLEHSQRMKSKIHITNGIENGFIDKDSTIPNGWYKGRVLKKRTHNVKRGYKQTSEHIRKIQESKKLNREKLLYG
jgi:group I intron endonuclease